jgi:hypothetical protein
MKQHISLAFSLCFLPFVIFQDLNGQIGNKEYEKGKIIDTIRCERDRKYSYALYLPGNYSKNVKWPVIYVFDPGARGSLALSCFKQAAEKYGYIAVCSNNSRNLLSGQELEDVINSLFIDTETRFSIDHGRLYTSGFSGGSRVASMIAINSESISGVIACGAGFPNYSGLKSLPTFDYYGLVGNRDMNYLEMCDLEKQLDSLGLSSEFHIFNGGHIWPSPDLIEEAVGWMDLKAMQHGTKVKNPEFINAFFRKFKERAITLSEEDNILESARLYSSIIKDFRGQIDILKLQVKLDSIQKTKEYLRLLKSRNKDLSWEREKQNTLIGDLTLRARSEELPDSIRNWWTAQINMLRKMEEDKDPGKQEAASRILMLINSVCYETGRDKLALKRYKAASICYLLESIVEPANKNIRFMLARIYALNNERTESLRSLDKAIKLGYNNRQSIEKDSAFIPLKFEKRYMELINTIK